MPVCSGDFAKIYLGDGIPTGARGYAAMTITSLMMVGVLLMFITLMAFVFSLWSDCIQDEESDDLNKVVESFMYLIVQGILGVSIWGIVNGLVN